MQRGHGTGCDAFTAFCDAAAAADTRFGGHASCDIGLGCLDVAEPKPFNGTVAQKRADVSFDPAAVHGESRGFDRSTAAANDFTGSGALQIPVADFIDGEVASLFCLGEGIGSSRDIAKEGLRVSSCLFGGHQPESTDYLPATFALWCSILDNKALCALCAQADAEPPQFTVPYNLIGTFDPIIRTFQTFNQRLCDFWHDLQHLVAVAELLLTFRPNLSELLTL